MVVKAKGTIVFMCFFVAAIIVGTVLSYAFRDLFSWLQINNAAIVGDALRLNTLVGGGSALVLAIFFGIFYQPSRQYVEQCVVEFNKVAFPEWRETKMATFTVVIVSLLASVILGLFDLVFSWWTSNNLFIW